MYSGSSVLRSLACLSWSPLGAEARTRLEKNACVPVSRRENSIPALSEFHRGELRDPAPFDAMQEEDSSFVGPGGGIQQGFFALHLDPGPVAKEGDSPSAARPKEYLDDVLRLVERGDTADHKFTLMFTGQWAHHLQSSECLLPFQEGSLPGSYAYQGEQVDSCTGLVHALEANGHEIALHHHPAGAPASWDGYSNTPPTGPEQLNYLGTVDDLLERVGQLSANGIQGITSCTTEEFPTGEHFIRVTSARGPTAYVDGENRGDLVSTPCAWIEDGNPVWRLRMRSAKTLKIDELNRLLRTLGRVNSAIPSAWSPRKDIADLGLGHFEPIFARLEEQNCVAGTHPYGGELSVYRSGTQPEGPFPVRRMGTSVARCFTLDQRKELGIRYSADTRSPSGVLPRVRAVNFGTVLTSGPVPSIRQYGER